MLAETLSQRGQTPPKQIRIFHHPSVEVSQALAAEMAQHLCGLGVEAKAYSMGEPGMGERMRGGDLIVVVGGDGSILRVSCLAALHALPVLGVNVGRLGFLAEVEPCDWKGALARVLVGDYWVEERMMLHVEHQRQGQILGSYEVLNEAVVSRGALARPIRLMTMIDGDPLTTYLADGLIVATATGSTAYALAVGGPILPPELKNLLIVPIAPHLCMERAVVLSHGATVKVSVRTEHQAILSADGQVEVQLLDRDDVVVCMSRFAARLARVQDPSYFYRNLSSRMSQNPAANKAK